MVDVFFDALSPPGNYFWVPALEECAIYKKHLGPF